MAFPTRDADLLAFSTNFDTRITATPTAYNLTAAQATAYGVVHDAWVVAYNAASSEGTRSKSLVAAKNTAKLALLQLGRELYGLVQDSLNVSDALKIELGITVRRAPTPIPAPANAPDIDIVSVNGRTVRIRLHDSTNPARRGKPAGVDGASIFSHVGETAPAQLADWTFEGSTSRTSMDVVFPATAAAGAKVWLTAYWFNERKQSGPTCPAVGTNLQFGGAMAA